MQAKDKPKRKTPAQIEEDLWLEAGSHAIGGGRLVREKYTDGSFSDEVRFEVRDGSYVMGHAAEPLRRLKARVNRIVGDGPGLGLIDRLKAWNGER